MSIVGEDRPKSIHFGDRYGGVQADQAEKELSHQDRTSVHNIQTPTFEHNVAFATIEVSNLIGRILEAWSVLCCHLQVVQRGYVGPCRGCQ